MVVYMNDIRKLEYIFQTLSDGNRLRILQIIGNKTCSVTEIVEATGLSQPLVSHHLRVLRQQMFLETERKGPFVYHKLKDSRILDALGIFSEIAAQLSDSTIKEKAFFCPPWLKHHFKN
jgi:DNA-binding transcriptional ArsR family regulator